MRKTALILSTLLLPSTAFSQAPSKPVVAVFPIDDRGAELSRTARENLRTYLADKLLATGSVELIPPSELKALLARQKLESYRLCVDEACQIELGKELAAEKTLATKILKIADRCIISAVVYDLRKATAERGEQTRGDCTEAALLRAIDTIVEKLSSSTVRVNAQPKPPPPRLPPKPVVDRASHLEKLSTVLRKSQFDDFVRWCSIEAAGIDCGKSDDTHGRLTLQFAEIARVEIDKCFFGMGKWCVNVHRKKGRSSIFFVRMKDDALMLAEHLRILATNPDGPKEPRKHNHPTTPKEQHGLQNQLDEIQEDNASAKGTLVINTRPVSTVHINGRDAGRTPFRIQLPVGKYSIVLSRLDGKGSESFESTIKPGEATRHALVWK